jgi:hypothetical protein
MSKAVKRTGWSGLPRALEEASQTTRKEVVNGVSLQSRVFMKNFRLWVDGQLFCIGDRSLGIRKRKPDDHQIDQAA